MLKTWLLLAAALVWFPQAPKLEGANHTAPCAQLVTADALASIGRSDVLTQVSQDHAGSSVCGWQASATSGFVVTRQTSEWFKYENTGGPKASFDLKRKSYDDVVGTDAVDGLGLEARITKHPQMPTVMVRRTNDVIYVMCTDCSREQTIAIAKLAARP